MSHQHTKKKRDEARERAANFEAELARAKAVQACTDAWLDGALEELAQVRVQAAELRAEMERLGEDRDRVLEDGDRLVRSAQARARQAEKERNELAAVLDRTMPEVERALNVACAIAFDAEVMSLHAVCLGCGQVVRRETLAEHAIGCAAHPLGRLLEALKKMVFEAEGFIIHGSEVCGRDIVCDEVADTDGSCDHHGRDGCPACECGVAELQAAVAEARTALALAEGSR